MIEELLVGFLEVEKQVEGVADARVLEFGPPQIEDESLHRRDALDGDRLFLHEALFQRVEIVLRRPGAGLVLEPDVDAAGLEVFERGRAIAIVGEFEVVEILLALHDGQIFGPVIGNALVDDLAARIDGFDLVGTVAKRRLDRRLAEAALLAVRVLAFPILLRHDVQFADDHRQLTIAFGIERELHLVVAGLLRLGDVLVIEGVERIDLLELLEREDHVLGGDGRAVVEFRLRPELERRRREIIGIGYAFGDERILRRWLVGARREQAVIKQP